MNVATRSNPAKPVGSRAAVTTRAWGLGMALMLGAPAAFAGAWTLPAGTGQAFLSTTDTSNDRYFDNDGSSFTNQNYHKVETDLHIEYGITDSLTGFVGPSLLSTSAAGAYGGHYFGLGYTDIGLRQRLYSDGRNVVSVQVTARVPGASDSSNPAEIGYTGMEYDLRALYGRSFQVGNWPAFFDAELGWHARNGAPPGEYRVDLTLGARPSARWLLLLQSFSVISDGRGTGVFDFAYRYYKIQPSVVWDFAPKWSAQLGAVATVAGRNSWREQGFTVGLWRSF
jgi:protein XagA